MEKKKTHTIILSDLHLGSKVSQPKKALEILESYNFKKLILLGDVFESLDLRHLNQDAWDFLTYVGKIAKDKKVRWVIGNHDEDLSHIFGSLLNATLYEMYTWQFHQEKYIAIHGHQFDRFWIDNAFISYLANRIYNFFQRVDFSKNKKISHWLKRRSKGWLRLSEKVYLAAINFAKENDAKYIFCGHTHKAIGKIKHEIQYYNSGCWTDIPCTYITIDEDNIKVHEY